MNNYNIVMEVFCESAFGYGSHWNATAVEEFEYAMAYLEFYDSIFRDDVFDSDRLVTYSCSGSLGVHQNCYSVSGACVCIIA